MTFPTSLDEGEKVSGIAALHTRLRKLILDGVYPPGSLIPQEELAQSLGVSRTPLREVLRLLQKEGLVEAGRYQRCRVTPFDPEALDTLYACRIQLETLGIALTVPRLTQEDLNALSLTLTEMHNASDAETWEKPHRCFHHLLVSHAGKQLCTTIASYGDQSRRYRYILEKAGPQVRPVAMDEHKSILKACMEQNRDEAGNFLARHLARTALSVLAQMAPEYEPIAVRTALSLAPAEISLPMGDTRAKKRSREAMAK